MFFSAPYSPVTPRFIAPPPRQFFWRRSFLAWCGPSRRKNVSRGATSLASQLSSSVRSSGASWCLSSVCPASHRSHLSWVKLLHLLFISNHSHADGAVLNFINSSNEPEITREIQAKLVSLPVASIGQEELSSFIFPHIASASAKIFSVCFVAATCF